MEKFECDPVKTPAESGEPHRNIGTPPSNAKYSCERPRKTSFFASCEHDKKHLEPSTEMENVHTKEIPLLHFNTLADPGAPDKLLNVRTTKRDPGRVDSGIRYSTHEVT